MIPQCGMESAPADLAAHTLVKIMRDNYNCPVGDVTFCLHELKYATLLVVLRFEANFS